MPSLINIARAKTATRKRQAQAIKDRLLNKVLGKIRQPTDGTDGLNGKDGRDAPTMADILSKVAPMLPEPVIKHTEKTVVQKLDAGEVTDVVQAMLDTQLPEMAKELRPKVELIREDISEEKLEGLVSKKELDDALKRVQDAITYHSGGGTPPVASIVNKINADEATNIITENDLSLTRINIVHATVSGSSVQLPKISDSYIVWVEDAVQGGGNITITREV